MLKFFYLKFTYVSTNPILCFTIQDRESSTVFVDNLPFKIKKIWVYNLFSRFGRINDVFIPDKRSSITKQSFGFVRFSSIREAALAIKEINNAWYWNQRLVVNFARFLRRQDYANSSQYTYGKNPRSSMDRDQTSRFKPKFQHKYDVNPHRTLIRGRANHSNPKNQNPQIGGCSRVNEVHQSRSYKAATTQGFQKGIRGKEVWRQVGVTETSKQGEERYVKSIGVATQKNTHSISIQPTGNGWLFRSVVGKMRKLVSIVKMKEIFNEEGILDVHIKSLGGRYLIMTLPNKENRDEFLQKKWTHLWFEQVKPWDGESAQLERFVWIRCAGMPLNAWAVSTFKDIGNLWGHFIEVDQDTQRGTSFELARILIATENQKHIEGEVELVVAGVKYLVKIEEESTFRAIKSTKQKFAHDIDSGSKDEDEDDEMDKSNNDKDWNKTDGSSPMDGLAAMALDKSDLDANKEKLPCPKVFILEYTTKHAEVDEQLMGQDTINSPAAPKSAGPTNLDMTEACFNGNSNLSLDLDSLVDESGSRLVETQNTVHEPNEDKDSVAQSEEGQDSVDTGLEELQKEAERLLELTAGPIEIGPSDGIRASQLEGINLQVDLNGQLETIMEEEDESFVGETQSVEVNSNHKNYPEGYWNLASAVLKSNGLNKHMADSKVFTARQKEQN